VTTRSWIRCFRPAPDAAVRLLCLPHAGGSAAFYGALTRLLHPRVEVLAVQYPGRLDRHAEPALTSVDAIADVLAPIAAGYADRPLALFGHSLGATIAFEVARRREEAGGRLAGLFASARAAPSRLRPIADRDWDAWSDADVLAEVRVLDPAGAPLLDDEELASLILPALRADFRAGGTYTYRPGPRLAAPVVALAGRADPRVDVDDVSAWEQHAASSFALHTYPGAHFYLTDRWPEVADRIATDLGVPLVHS
jgi:pyochelin biosynthetic protein PchC